MSVELRFGLCKEALKPRIKIIYLRGRKIWECSNFKYNYEKGSGVGQTGLGYCPRTAYQEWLDKLEYVKRLDAFHKRPPILV